MAQPVYEPFTHTQSTPSDEWLIEHLWGRPVSYTAYDTTGNEIEGQYIPVEKSPGVIDLDRFKLAFNYDMEGSVVVS